MTRLRLVFAGVALALALSGGLLAQRALRAAEAERAARHRAVAERVFDEMERSLSAFLAEEEARPVDAYRFYRRDADGVPRRSPLSRPPVRPFVRGHFQLEADGSLTTPLRPSDEAAARARGDWPPADPSLRSAADEVLAVAGAAFGASRRQARAPDEAPGRAAFAEETAPGAAEPERAEEEAPAAASAAGGDAPAAPASAGVSEPLSRPGATVVLDAPQKAGRSRAYEALGALNRGAEQRADRAPVVVIAQAPADADTAKRQRLPAATPRSEAPAPPRAPGSALAPAPAAPETAGAAPARARTAPDAPAPRAELPAPAPRPLRVEIAPLAGQRAGDTHLLLTRGVRVDGSALRQGLVVDVPRLAAALGRETLGGALAGASLALGSAGAAPPPADPARPFRYRHRFAEPFDALAADLALAPLEGVSGTGTVLALAALLALAAGGGLLALYRMVSVTVAFAQRRANFVAAVTHELKTPLTSIRMYAEMLRDGLVPSDEKRREYVGTITDESERLSRLVDDVLELARLERGARGMALRTGALGPEVAEAAERLAPQAARAGFRLVVDVEPGLPPVRFERDALHQVLANLVDNALKYAGDAADRSVRLSLSRDGDGVALCVRDAGPGAPPEALAQLFEPFYRAGDELTRRRPGVGIGLALVKGLAGRMDASVAARNLAAGGLEVRLRFPAA